MPKRAKPLLKPYTPDTMTSKDTVAKFANALEQFELIDGQPSDTKLTQIREVVVTLLQILYDEMGGTHNLISLIRPMAAYTTCYGAEFAEPTQVDAYDTTIDDDATSVVCAHRNCTQIQARRPRQLRDGAARDCEVHPCRRQGYVGAVTLRQRDALHQRRAKGASFPPPSGVHRSPRPRPTGAA